MERENRNIEKLVEELYKAYGFEGHASVDAGGDNKIVITLNRDNPYMGVAFWCFTGALDKRLKELGYEKKNSELLRDFYFIAYEK